MFGDVPLALDPTYVPPQGPLFSALVPALPSVSVSADDLTAAQNNTAQGSGVYLTATSVVSQNANAGVSEATVVDSQVTNAKIAVYELQNTQTLVDNAINSLAAGADKTRLGANRDLSRAYYSTTVQPLISWTTTNQQAFLVAGADSVLATAALSGYGFGDLNSTDQAVMSVSAALALISACNQNLAKEQAILSDPALAGIVVSPGGSTVYLVGAVIALMAGYYLWRNK